MPVEPARPRDAEKLCMDPHSAFFRSLRREEKQLVALKRYLYDGAWDEIVKDLEARRDGKPFVLELTTRIEEDLERIRRLAEYEREHGVDLSDYLNVHERENPEL